MKHFRITDGKGFHITFENGWTVSVQWGSGNYSDNHTILAWTSENYAELGALGSNEAEIAAFDPEGEWHTIEGDDDEPQDILDFSSTVAGYQTPAQVLAFMNLIAAKPKFKAAPNPPGYSDGNDFKAEMDL